MDINSAWEEDRENILPISKGRSVYDVGVALLQPEKINQQQHLFEMKLRTYDGDDPLEVWDDYIHWAEQHFPTQGKSGMVYQLRKSCIQKNHLNQRYKNDIRFIKIFLKYLEQNPSPNDGYQFLINEGYGTMYSIVFENYANYLENIGNIKAADEILIKGISLNAQPIDDLIKIHQNFEIRVLRKAIDEQTKNEHTDLNDEDNDHRKGLTDMASVARNGQLPYQRTLGYIQYQSGQQPQPISSQTIRNKRIKILEESNHPISSLLKCSSHFTSFPDSEKAICENVQKPDKWTKAKLPQNSGSNKIRNADFQIHIDEGMNQQSQSPKTINFSALKSCKVPKDAETTGIHYKVHWDQLFVGLKEISYEELMAERRKIKKTSDEAKKIEKKRSSARETDINISTTSSTTLISKDFIKKNIVSNEKSLDLPTNFIVKSNLIPSPADNVCLKNIENNSNCATLSMNSVDQMNKPGDSNIAVQSTNYMNYNIGSKVDVFSVDLKKKNECNDYENKMKRPDNKIEKKRSSAVRETDINTSTTSTILISRESIEKNISSSIEKSNKIPSPINDVSLKNILKNKSNCDNISMNSMDLMIKPGDSNIVVQGMDHMNYTVGSIVNDHSVDLKKNIEFADYEDEMKKPDDSNFRTNSLNAMQKNKALNDIFGSPSKKNPSLDFIRNQVMQIKDVVNESMTTNFYDARKCVENIYKTSITNKNTNDDETDEIYFLNNEIYQKDKDINSRKTFDFQKLKNGSVFEDIEIISGNLNSDKMSKHNFNENTLTKLNIYDTDQEMVNIVNSANEVQILNKLDQHLITNNFEMKGLNNCEMFLDQNIVTSTECLSLEQIQTIQNEYNCYFKKQEIFVSKEFNANVVQNPKRIQIYKDNTLVDSDSREPNHQIIKALKDTIKKNDLSKSNNFEVFLNEDNVTSTEIIPIQIKKIKIFDDNDIDMCSIDANHHHKNFSNQEITHSRDLPNNKINSREFSIEHLKSLDIFKDEETVLNFDSKGACPKTHENFKNINNKNESKNSNKFDIFINEDIVTDTEFMEKLKIKLVDENNISHVDPFPHNSINQKIPISKNSSNFKQHLTNIVSQNENRTKICKETGNMNVEMKKPNLQAANESKIFDYQGEKSNNFEHFIDGDFVTSIERFSIDNQKRFKVFDDINIECLGYDKPIQHHNNNNIQDFTISKNMYSKNLFNKNSTNIKQHLEDINKNENKTQIFIDRCNINLKMKDPYFEVINDNKTFDNKTVDEKLNYFKDFIDEDFVTNAEKFPIDNQKKFKVFENNIGSKDKLIQHDNNLKIQDISVLKDLHCENLNSENQIKNFTNSNSLNPSTKNINFHNFNTCIVDDNKNNIEKENNIEIKLVRDEISRPYRNFLEKSINKVVDMPQYDFIDHNPHNENLENFTNNKENLVNTADEIGKKVQNLKDSENSNTKSHEYEVFSVCKSTSNKNDVEISDKDIFTSTKRFPMEQLKNIKFFDKNDISYILPYSKNLTDNELHSEKPGCKSKEKIDTSTVNKEFINFDRLDKIYSGDKTINNITSFLYDKTIINKDINIAYELFDDNIEYTNKKLEDINTNLIQELEENNLSGIFGLDKSNNIFERTKNFQNTDNAIAAEENYAVIKNFVDPNQDTTKQNVDDYISNSDKDEIKLNKTIQINDINNITNNYLHQCEADDISYEENKNCEINGNNINQCFQIVPKMQKANDFELSHFEKSQNLLDQSVFIDFENPFSQELTKLYLSKLKPPLNSYIGYHSINALLPKIAVKSKLTLGINQYQIISLLGKGGYAKAYHIRKTQTNEDSVVKLQIPQCPWEFYITRELYSRLSNSIHPIDIRPSIMYISEAFFYTNSSLFLNEKHNFGTLLDFVNLMKQNSMKIPNWFSLILIHELIIIVSSMHLCNIIHGDLKLDNILLIGFPKLDENESINNLFNYKQTRFLKLIDFGQAIDMKMYPPGTTFIAKVSTENFKCSEMKENKPWSFQIDLYGIVATLYVLLCGTYLKPLYCSEKLIWYIFINKRQFPMIEDFLNEFSKDFLNIKSALELPNLEYYACEIDKLVNNMVTREQYNSFIGTIEKMYASTASI